MVKIIFNYLRIINVLKVYGYETKFKNLKEINLTN